MRLQPENEGITLSVLAYQDLEGSVAWERQPGVYERQTPVQHFRKNEPVEIRIGGLSENTQYYYRFHSRQPGSQVFTSGTECPFHTARSKDATFTFTVTADARLDEHTSPDIYLRALANIRADHPDCRKTSRLSTGMGKLPTAILFCLKQDKRECTRLRLSLIRLRPAPRALA